MGTFWIKRLQIKQWKNGMLSLQSYTFPIYVSHEIKQGIKWFSGLKVKMDSLERRWTLSFLLKMFLKAVQVFGENKVSRLLGACQICSIYSATSFKTA